MGLATSQVRLLALTSRKADVEMQIQLNSKRKTMLTRESTELAKLYYAKLQNARIQYSTTNGYKDVTYSYLMGSDNSNYFDQVVTPTANSTIDKKVSNSMILTDAYGRVILSNSMLGIVISTLNHDITPGLKDAIVNADGSTKNGKESVETLTITAMKYLLDTMGASKNELNTIGTSTTAASIASVYNSLYEGTAWEESTGAKNPQLGLEVLQYLLRNGMQKGETLYRKNDGVGGFQYYTSMNCEEGTEITPENGTFYIIKNYSDSYKPLSAADGSMYWNGDIIPNLNATIASQICNMFSFYGSIFSAAFNGNNNGISNYNVAANIIWNEDKQEYESDPNGNSAYQSVSNVENLQEGLKSGLYQLVNVATPVTGGYSKAQGLDYFKTLNYVVEQADSSERETITAWYDAARADLNEKESYWDSEITALSSELNAITTEIDSVKKLREDAISSTFKWGNA